MVERRGSATATTASGEAAEASIGLPGTVRGGGGVEWSGGGATRNEYLLAVVEAGDGGRLSVGGADAVAESAEVPDVAKR
jgi:hypothetical protein